MPNCPACGAGMVIHDDGFSSKVWKCQDYSHHPTVTTRGDGANAIMAGGAVLTGIGILGAIFTGGATTPLIAKGIALMAGGASGGDGGVGSA